MKVFLTGGTGFIGQPLAQALLRRGWQVTVLVRRPDSGPAQALRRWGAEVVAGDVTDRESMRAGMSGVDIVVHNAGVYEFGVTAQARQGMQAINVTGTEHVLGLALELGIPRAVYVSSMIYYGPTGREPWDETHTRQAPPSTFYEQTKVDAHQIALQYQARGLPLVIVCPATVVGPNDHAVLGYFLRMYLNRLLPFMAWEPEAIVSGVHVNDVAEGIALAAEQGRAGETYILAGDPVTKRDILRVWMSYPGGMKTRFYMPGWMAIGMFAPMEPLLRLAGLPAFMSRETARTGSLHYSFSGAKARRELGWTYCPASQLYSQIVEGEQRLLAQRKQRSLVARLKPVEGE